MGTRYFVNIVTIDGLLRRIGFSPVFDATSHSHVIVPISKNGGQRPITITLIKSILRLDSVAVSGDAIPSNARDKLCRILMEQKAGGLCHYTSDVVGNVIVSVKLPREDLTGDLLARAIRDIVLEVNRAQVNIAKGCPLVKGTIVLFPARLQPPHKGHIDAITRVLEGDPSLLADPHDEESVRVFRQVETLIISLGGRGRERQNPLSTGERKDLMEFEIANNPRLERHTHRIKITDALALDDTMWLPTLLRTLPRQPEAIVSANTMTIQAARDLGLRGLLMAREKNPALKGSRIRKLIAESQMSDVRRFLTDTVYERCDERGYFDIIRNAENSE